tara:strand:+ start:631 stop:846 length:216 start_codon:yes stop_codon:yes gene_type:complete
MRIRKGKKLILSTSNDGIIVIADVDANKVLTKGEYEVSEGCMNRNVRCGTFKDIGKQCSYDGRLYALATDL